MKKLTVTEENSGIFTEKLIAINKAIGKPEDYENLSDFMQFKCEVIGNLLAATVAQGLNIGLKDDKILEVVHEVYLANLRRISEVLVEKNDELTKQSDIMH